jgi:hypothetical protein
MQHASSLLQLLKPWLYRQVAAAIRPCSLQKAYVPGNQTLNAQHAWQYLRSNWPPLTKTKGNMTRHCGGRSSGTHAHHMSTELPLLQARCSMHASPLTTRTAIMVSGASALQPRRHNIVQDTHALPECTALAIHGQLNEGVDAMHCWGRHTWRGNDVYARCNVMSVGNMS